jgi:hypothetical protein
MRCHKVLTYIEYSAVSGVFRTIDPLPPLHPASVSSPRTKGGVLGGGGTHSPAGEGVGVNISEDARHWIGLLQYNPYVRGYWVHCPKKTAGFHGPCVTERNTVYTPCKYMYINTFDGYFLLTVAGFLLF